MKKILSVFLLSAMLVLVWTVVSLVKDQENDIERLERLERQIGSVMEEVTSLHMCIENGIDHGAILWDGTIANYDAAAHSCNLDIFFDTLNPYVSYDAYDEWAKKDYPETTWRDVFIEEGLQFIDFEE